MAEQRIAVVGCSGTGKTTTARQIAQVLGLPHLELDSVYHQAQWKPLEEERFRQAVTAFMDRHPEWVIDGNYAPVRTSIWDRSTTTVWLDPPRGRMMRQIVWRTLRRFVLREELWNGNREPISNLLSLDPEKSVIAWAWVRHPAYRETYTSMQADPRWQHLVHHRFSHPSAIDAWLQQLQESPMEGAPDDGAQG